MKTLIEMVAHHPFFRGMNPEHVCLATDGAKLSTFPAGTVMIREGEPANQFYLLVSGKVALEAHEPADGTTLVMTLGGGEVLGWSWLFAPFAWHFQARALEPTQVVILNGAHLLVTAERNHAFGYELMKRVAQVVIQRLQASRKKLVALATHPAA